MFSDRDRGRRGFHLDHVRATGILRQRRPAEIPRQRRATGVRRSAVVAAGENQGHANRRKYKAKKCRSFHRVSIQNKSMDRFSDAF